MKKLLYICLLLIPFIYFSCSEENEPTPNLYTKLLTGDQSKTWQLSAFYIIERDNEDNTFRLNIDNSCEDSIDYYDNYYTFYANAERKFEITEGPQKCSNFAHDDYYLEYNWSFVNATASLTFVFLPLFGEVFVPYTVMELTEDKLVIQFFDEEVNDRQIYRFVLNAVKEE